MNIIIPMAGMGKRMRPHTLTVPKPLIPIAGKPIVQRLVEDIAKVCGNKVDHVAFVVGHFGTKVEEALLQIAKSIGAEGSIHYQEEALGTAHAILCAEQHLNGPVVVAFADTLFKADFKLNTEEEGIIWVQKVKDPSAFGVVKIHPDGHITDFIEKPEEFVSDLAIIGIYYFKRGDNLKEELQYLIDHDVRDRGEYQITDALENMKRKGLEFRPGQVTEWLDCGNKNATVYTNQRYLEYLSDSNLVSKKAHLENCMIIPPVFIADDVVAKDAVIGPHVSIGRGSSVERSVLKNSIIQENSTIKHASIENSMIGNHALVEGKAMDLSLGDYNQILP
jgi:glucose-1-phosphate thymidylyltransferase